MPFFCAQQYDVTISYIGHAERGGALDVDGSLKQRRLRAPSKRRADARGGECLPRSGPAMEREVRAFRLGLHYVGDWHTHPQCIAEASGTDRDGIADLVRKSRHDLNAFVLAVIGKARCDSKGFEFRSGKRRHPFRLPRLHPGIRARFGAERAPPNASRQ